MSNSMQRFAELEARVAVLTAENQKLRAQASGQSANTQLNTTELVDAIAAQLERVERNLREDFISKFAGSFLLATETITSRVTALGEREAQLEEEQKNLETRLQNHYNMVGAKLDEASERQRKSMMQFVEILNQHHARNNETLKAQRATLDSYNAVAEATANAARLCKTFAEDYRITAIKARESITTFTNEATINLRHFFTGIKSSAEEAMLPVMHQVKKLTAEQLYRRFWHILVGTMLGLIFSSGFAWVSQPPRYVQQDAEKWRNFTHDLSPEQYDKVVKLVAEIEAKQKALGDKAPQ